jgi:hypothetical protein
MPTTSVDISWRRHTELLLDARRSRHQHAVSAAPSGFTYVAFDWYVTLCTKDMVARSPTAPPWASYPLHPIICASLIADIAAIFVTISSDAVLGALRDVGLTARWLLEPDLGQLQPSQDVLRGHDGIRATGVRTAELGRLTLELPDVVSVGQRGEGDARSQRHRRAAMALLHRRVQGLGLARTQTDNGHSGNFR